jgi:hypothetical protein
LAALGKVFVVVFVLNQLTAGILLSLGADETAFGLTLLFGLQRCALDIGALLGSRFTQSPFWASCSGLSGFELA